jgi:hypothetical protein
LIVETAGCEVCGCHDFVEKFIFFAWSLVAAAGGMLESPSRYAVGGLSLVIHAVRERVMTLQRRVAHHAGRWLPGLLSGIGRGIEAISHALQRTVQIDEVGVC